MSWWLFGKHKPERIEPTVTVLPVKRRIPVRLKNHPPKEHATRLVKWLREDEEYPDYVLAQDLIHIYEDMCSDIGWRQRHWNTVAPHVKTLLDGRKTYIWLHEDGMPRRRVRVYRIHENNVIEFRIA